MNNVDKVNLSDDLPSQTNNSTDHLTMSVSSLLNDIPLNTLSDFYDIETSLFKKRIDKLNLKFYWESEGLSSQKEIPKPYSKLFLILFKQINLFNEEIERLNLIIKEKNNYHIKQCAAPCQGYISKEEYSNFPRKRKIEY